MNTETEPPQIIARAFDSEPCVLYAVEMQSSGRHVNVCRDLPARPIIGWPIEDAFDYDVDDFTKLWAAYSDNRKDELATLYAELRTRPRRFVTALESRPEQPEGKQ